MGMSAVTIFVYEVPFRGNMLLYNFQRNLLPPQQEHFLYLQFSVMHHLGKYSSIQDFGQPLCLTFGIIFPTLSLQKEQFFNLPLFLQHTILEKIIII